MAAVMQDIPENVKCHSNSADGLSVMMTAIIAEIPEAIRQKMDQSVTITKYTAFRITKRELTGLLCGFIAALS
ncbi:hypothetical protein ISO84_08465 [Morganella morganii subsp. morganii]|nr:hypothetical protein [Morganella morganii]MBT0336809.1 hypothetical protein [Morganella morganii subsp. morganii]